MKTVMAVTQDADGIFYVSFGTPPSYFCLHNKRGMKGNELLPKNADLLQVASAALVAVKELRRDVRYVLSKLGPVKKTKAASAGGR